MLLAKCYAEARLTIDAYRTVFEESTSFGGKQLTASVETKGDLPEKLAKIEADIAELNEQVSYLNGVCESLEFREAAKAKQYETTDKEILNLRAEGQQLEDLLKVLRPSKEAKK